MRVSVSIGFRGRVRVRFDIGFMVMTNVKGLGLRFSVWIRSSLWIELELGLG